jgi:hypothetical protein
MGGIMIQTTVQSAKKEVREMEYMKTKIARKVAYSLWEYEMKLRNEDSEYLSGYSKHLRDQIEEKLKRKLLDKDYKTLLNLISEHGFVGHLSKLQDFLVKELTQIAEQDEFINKKVVEIDD